MGRWGRKIGHEIGAPRCALAALLLLGGSGGQARANLRAPIVEPEAPSSALHPLAPPGDLLRVLDETLSFRCAQATPEAQAACDVQARYRIEAHAAVTVELSFVLPQAAPLTVRVGATPAVVETDVSKLEPIRDEEVRSETSRPHPAAVQARFSAVFAAGVNVVTISYRQPLGRREYGHGYFRRGRFVDFFRYELWPLGEWKHGPGFAINGEVVIARPASSWWQRLFETRRSVGCRGTGALGSASLQQRDAELHLTFQIADPIPPHLWCEIGDEDLVPAP